MRDGISSDEELPLIRHEVLKKNGTRVEGAIILARPIPIKLAGLCGIIFIVFIAIFILTFDYGKTEVIQGELIPQGGNATIIATQSGYLKKYSIVDGAKVKVGDFLFEIDSGRTSDSITNEKDISDILSFKRNMLENQFQIQQDLWQRQLEKLCSKASALRDDIDAAKSMNDLQNQRVNSSKMFLDKNYGLHEKGFISDMQWRQYENDLNLERTKSIESARAIKVAVRDFEQARAECEQQRKDQKLIKSNSDIALNSVTQEIVEQKLRSHIRIISPVEGTVSSVALAHGGNVQQGETLATIIPSNMPLEAVLFAPSKSMGKIAPGQKVYLKFDAFPYQKYGAMPALVRAVDHSPTRDQQSKSSTGSENVYKIFITLSTTSNLFKAKHNDMKTGMRVEASIETDRRLLISWILDPLSSINSNRE